MTNPNNGAKTQRYHLVASINAADPSPSALRFANPKHDTLHLFLDTLTTRICMVTEGEKIDLLYGGQPSLVQKVSIGDHTVITTPRAKGVLDIRREGLRPVITTEFMITLGNTITSFLDRGRERELRASLNEAIQIGQSMAQEASNQRLRADNAESRLDAAMTAKDDAIAWIEQLLAESARTGNLLNNALDLAENNGKAATAWRSIAEQMFEYVMAHAPKQEAKAIAGKPLSLAFQTNTIPDISTFKTLFDQLNAKKLAGIPRENTDHLDFPDTMIIGNIESDDGTPCGDGFIPDDDDIGLPPLASMLRQVNSGENHSTPSDDTIRPAVLHSYDEKTIEIASKLMVMISCKVLPAPPAAAAQGVDLTQTAHIKMLQEYIDPERFATKFTNPEQVHREIALQILMTADRIVNAIELPEPPTQKKGLKEKLLERWTISTSAPAITDPLEIWANDAQKIYDSVNASIRQKASNDGRGTSTPAVA